MNLLRVLAFALLFLITVHVYSDESEQCEERWERYIEKLESGLIDEKIRFEEIVKENYEKRLKLAESSDNKDWELAIIEAEYEIHTASIDAYKEMINEIKHVKEKYGIYDKDAQTGKSECITDHAESVPVETLVKTYKGLVEISLFELLK